MSESKTLKRTKEWNFIDDILSKWRTKEIKRYVTKDTIMCDVGCGQDAGLLMDISHLIKEGYGFDFNLKDSITTKGNMILSNTDFLDDNRKYDVITLMAVLEHLPYPDEVDRIIKSIYDRLPDGGYFIMTTPDKKAQSILEFLAYNLHIINEEEIRDHKHYFSKAELIKLMRRHEFRDIAHKHFQLGLNNLVVCKK